VGRYRMAQKWFAFGDDFAIEDADGREAFYVDGRAFSFGDDLSVEGADGHEVARIRQRLLAWGPTYEIVRDGRLVAVVRKHLFTLFRARFSVDVPGPDDLEATGDFLDHEYEIHRGEDLVAEVSKRWFSWTDTYGIDVADGEDDVLVLATAVVVDLCCHQPE